VLRQPNGGPARARHAGLIEAKAPLVVILDDDMTVEPTFVAAHAKAHDGAVNRVVLGEIRPDPALATMPLFERFHAQMLKRFLADVDAGTLRVRGTHLCTGNVSFRRESYLSCGGFDPAFDRSEDAELGIRLERSGAEFAVSREAFSVHGSDHTSLSVWMRRAYRYGINDHQIGRKHADWPAADPWRFLHLMNPLARPLLVTCAFFPSLGGAIAHGAMAFCLALDAAGLSRLAIVGTTVVYGMQYFRGVRRALGGVGATLRDLRRYLSVRKALRP
jgi:GT2 family glycosyltransferase